MSWSFTPFAFPSGEAPSARTPSKKHHVLCLIPPDSAAAQWDGVDRWGADPAHALLPCSQVARWADIKEALYERILESCGSGHGLAETIKSYNMECGDITSSSFAGLKAFSLQNDELFRRVVPEIVSFALQLPKLLDKPVPLLGARTPRSVTLSQMQVASLLANAVLCTFPQQPNKPAAANANLTALFAGADQGSVERIKCIFHYFERVGKKEPDGFVTYTRRVLAPSRVPRWDASTERLRPILATSTLLGFETEGLGMLQAVRLNGPLNLDSVQQEAIFATQPELLATILIAETLAENEALVVTGTERFSATSGEGTDFKFAGDQEDATPRDYDFRRQNTVLFLNAVPSAPAEQYDKSDIDRALANTFAGLNLAGVDEDRLLPVAAHKLTSSGDPQLAALLLVMAASEAGRQVRLFTDGDAALVAGVETLMRRLIGAGITVGSLYTMLCLAERPQGQGQLFDGLLAMVANDLQQWCADESSATPPPGGPSMPRPVTDSDDDANFRDALGENPSLDLLLDALAELTGVNQSRPSDAPDFDDVANRVASDASPDRSENGRVALRRQLSNASSVRSDNGRVALRRQLSNASSVRSDNGRVALRRQLSNASSVSSDNGRVALRRQPSNASDLEVVANRRQPTDVDGVIVARRQPIDVLDYDSVSNNTVVNHYHYHEAPTQEATQARSPEPRGDVSGTLNNAPLSGNNVHVNFSLWGPK